MGRFDGGRRSGLVLALVALVLVCCFSSGLSMSIKINNNNIGKFLWPFAYMANFTELGKEMLAIMNTTVLFTESVVSEKWEVSEGSGKEDSQLLHEYS
jgi:hypothetical protein